MSQLTEKFTRQRITLLIIKLDRCANVYGVNDGVTSFCTASKLPGDECFNSFHTCQDKDGYVKTTEDWKICTKGVAPFPGVEYWEPILEKVTLTPTEILESKTAKARLKFRLLNYKADTVSSELKAGGDLYARNRSTISGTRLRKQLERHPNLKGRLVEQYEGALGDSLATFMANQTFQGNLWDFDQDVNGNVSAESEDLLTKMEDKANEIPPRVEGKLVNDISSADLSLTLDAPTEYPAAPNYLFLGSGESGELIKYGAKDDVTGIFSSLSRGQENTLASEFSQGEKVKRVQWWPFQNPFDIALDILDKTKANILYNELMQPLDVSTWVAEDLTITVKRNVNIPGEVVPELSEAGNIWKDTQKVDLNDKAIINSASIAWNHIPGRNHKEELSYTRGNIFANTDSISANDTDEVLLEPMLSRFIRFGDVAEELVEEWVAKALRRYVIRRLRRRHIIDFKVEFKDFERKTGENIGLTTDKIEDITGQGLSGSLFMLIRRAPGASDIALRAIKEPEISYGVWAPEELDGVEYANATALQKRTYGAWANENKRIPDGSPYDAEGNVWY
jgi:hypothetical protein